MGMIVENTVEYQMLEEELEEEREKCKRLETQFLLEQGTTKFYRDLLAKVLVQFHQEVYPESDFVEWKLGLAQEIEVTTIP